MEYNSEEAKDFSQAIFELAFDLKQSESQEDFDRILGYIKEEIECSEIYISATATAVAQIQNKNKVKNGHRSC